MHHPPIKRAARRVRDVLRKALLGPMRRAYSGSDQLRHNYWNQRAADIDQQWGSEQQDFPVVAKVIEAARPRRLLDFGCGSGRLFPLYQRCGVEEVVGQDIAETALAICRERWTFPGLALTSCQLEDLPYAHRHFGLIVSNQVLQHVPPDRVAAMVQKLADLGDNIYINEMSDTDYTDKFFFLFKHDYRALFAPLGFAVVATGQIGNQRWQWLAREQVN